MYAGAAVDAGWLKGLEEGENADVLLRLRVLSALDARRVPLLLDFEYHIVGEYDRNLAKNSIAKRFVSNRLRHGPVEWWPGALDAAQNHALRADKFDMDDASYVAVAHRCNSGLYLTHEAKHRDGARVKLLRDLCGVDVHTEQEILDLLGG